MKKSLSRCSHGQPSKTVQNKFSKRYLAALGNFLKKYPHGEFQEAHEVGDFAVTLSLETLELARIHKQSLAELEPQVLDCTPITHDDLTKQALLFFTEMIIPVEKTHRTALNAGFDLNQLNAEIIQQAKYLTAARSKLRKNIALRQAAGKALERHREMAGKLLEESRRLHQLLQEMNRKLLTEQEEDRKIMSHIFQDEIAQTMLGIQFRLLALKKEHSLSNTDLQKEIAITQQWVKELAIAIRCTARELGIQYGK